VPVQSIVRYDGGVISPQVIGEHVTCIGDRAVQMREVCACPS
jgi:hypothetical protein